MQLCKSKYYIYSIFLDLIFLLLVQKYRVVNSLIGFLSEKLVLCKKWANEHFAKKNRALCSFLVSDLCDLLTVAHFWWATWAIRERFAHMAVLKRANERMAHLKKKLTKKLLKTYIKYDFIQKIWANCSFFYLSEWAIRTQKTERFAVLSWATWANRSLSLFCHEQPERFTHGCSFVMSDLSNLLTVAHFSWTIWAIHSQSLICPQWSEQMSNEQMSEIPTLQK